MVRVLAAVMLLFMCGCALGYCLAAMPRGVSVLWAIPTAIVLMAGIITGAVYQHGWN